jgi:hypothetical protein
MNLALTSSLVDHRLRLIKRCIIELIQKYRFQVLSLTVAGIETGNQDEINLT